MASYGKLLKSHSLILVKGCSIKLSWVEPQFLRGELLSVEEGARKPMRPTKLTKGHSKKPTKTLALSFERSLSRNF